MEDHCATRRFLLELSPNSPLYIEGKLLADAPNRTREELIQLASDRDEWRKARPTTTQKQML